MCMREQGQLRCINQWEWQMPLSNHVYCVAITFKMTELVGLQICIQFCINLEHSSVETIQMIQRSQLVTGSFIMTMYPLIHHILCSFFMKHQITQVTQPSCSPDLTPCDIWLFPKLKSPLKGKRIQTVDEIQENMLGQLMVIGRIM